MLAACTNVPQQSSPAPSGPTYSPSSTPLPPVVIGPDPARFDWLLFQAEEALRQDRLTTPTDDSAYDYYGEVLRQEPRQQEARRGMERIVDRYLMLARDAIDAREWNRAKTMLDRASFVDADHVGIDALAAQLESLRSAEQRVLDLDGTALKQRGEYLAARIRGFGRFARAANARVTIRVPDDATGRWVYGQLDEAPGSRRIRAHIMLGSPFEIVVTMLGQ